MQEIKFRVWDKSRKKMLHEGDVELDSYAMTFDGRIVEAADTDLVLANGAMSYLEIMQYTGLKDKNNKDIWEGDLLLSKENHEVYRVDELIPVHRHTHVTNIGWMDSDGFHPRTEPAGQHDNIDDWMSWPEMYEVIGNIYENPNLLTP